MLISMLGIKWGWEKDRLTYLAAHKAKRKAAGLSSMQGKTTNVR